MNKILGLDLGTNSIGWAIRDTGESENQIIDKGVLTFEKGVGEGKSGEFPLVQKRTESRSKRRNYQAEKYRKWALLQILIEHGMCPLSTAELDTQKDLLENILSQNPLSIGSGMTLTQTVSLTLKDLVLASMKIITYLECWQSVKKKNTRCYSLLILIF
jgi:hypothetical protein